MRLSIITPTLNAGQYLRDCIGSIAASGGDHVEHIIVDGHSSDETLAIAGRGITRPNVLRQLGSGGIYAAINEGIRAANGDIIGILNADDMYDSGTLPAVLRAFEGHCDIAYGAAIVRSPRGEDRLWRGSHLSLIKRMSVPHPTVFVSADTYRQIGVFDETMRYASDYEFLLRALQCNRRFRFSEDIRVIYRTGGVGARNFWRTSWENWRIHRNYFGFRRATTKLGVRLAYGWALSAQSAIGGSLLGEDRYVATKRLIARQIRARGILKKEGE